MIRASHIRLVISVAAALLLTCVVSCNKFRYGYGGNESNLSFSLSWDRAGLSSDEAPEGVTVVMSRRVNTLRYVWTLDGKGNYIFPEAAENEKKTPKIENGDYYTVAFSDCGGFYDVIGVDEFVGDVSTSMLNLYIRIPEVADDEASMDKDMADFNPYAGFIHSADKPLCVEIIKDLVFPTDGPVVLHPEKATRALTFRIAVNSEDGVTIDWISGVLSGVVDRTQLMSGLMTDTHTAKVKFDFEKCGTELREDTIYDIYEGSLNVLGLFPPADSRHVTGPGILQVSVAASVSEREQVRQRVFHTGLNLKSIIEDAGLMIQASDRSGYSMKPQSEIDKFDIAQGLTVMKNNILASEAEGLEQWFENETEIMPEV
jgi:hypothetical protein